MEVQEKLATRDVRNVRHTIGLAWPPALQPGELTVSHVAARLGTKPGTVYYWLKADLLPHHKRATGAVCIPFSAEIEAALRARPTVSRHLAKLKRRQ